MIDFLKFAYLHTVTRVFYEMQFIRYVFKQNGRGASIKKLRKEFLNILYIKRRIDRTKTDFKGESEKYSWFVGIIPDDWGDRIEQKNKKRLTNTPNQYIIISGGIEI